MSKRSIVVFALTLTLSAAQTFEWFAESPRNCARDPTQCCGSACQGDRDVYCRVRGTNVPISPLFCADTPNPFSSRVNCDENECRRDCVVSEWSPWGACSATCGNLATEYRSRRVLVPPEAGRSCPDLSQTRTCRNATLRLPCPAPPTPSPTAPIFYLWRLGPWSACQSMSGNGSDCGPGSIFRVVNCVASNGTVVGDNNCKANPRETSPINRQACNLPCNCQVDQWSPWSNCSAQCYTKSNSSSSSDSDLPYHERTRTVIRTSQFGGTPCPALFARQSCDVDSLPDCPRYQWYNNASWFDCNLDVADDVCGFGTQRRTVFCVLENDPTNTPVDDRFCTGEFLPPGAVKTAAPVKPLTTRPCQILCPQDCVTGAWSEWGQCSRSCGEGGVRRRTRPLLVPSLNGGAPCGDLNGTAPCESINCTFWSIGRYSACVPTDFIKRCGSGIRKRHISCLNALNQISNDSMCPGSRPVNQDDCYLPCDGDCVLTEWSQWTGCPGTCGGAGIVQKRTRSILLYNETSGRQCVDDDQLTQRKPCNVFVPCITYVWRHEKWANCIFNSSLDDEGTGSGSGDNESSSATKCGPSIGVQDRNVYCEQQFSGFGRRRVSDATCFDPNNVVVGDSVKPATVQQCDINCPVDCEVSPWSDWSACSATCGSATRLRSRFVTKAAAFGGASCPPNRDGIITDTSSCDDVPPCYAYAWSTTAWSECQLIRLPNVDVSSTCGPGFRTRDVTCRRDGDNQTVADGVCSAGLLTARPSDVLNCNIPCEDECEFSTWTAFSDCSLTCGRGSKSRTRRVLFKNSTLSAAERNQTCPHIKADQLIERDPCNDFPCLEYGWVASEWLTCIPANDVDSCGDGIEERHVNCETLTDHVFVSLQFCFSVGVAPNRTRSCHVPCPVDCVVGNWSAWSVCNGSCDSHGLGYETRTRDMLVAPADGGRPCFELEQRRPCLSDCEWDIGAWGECVLNDGSLSCGDGRRNRSVTCLVNGVLVNDNRCFVLGDKPSPLNRLPGKPISDEACRTPCPNDCVVTEWSEWSNCIPVSLERPVEEVCRNSPGSANFLGQHSRQRSILRRSSNCPSTLEQDQDCRPAVCQTFRWHVTAWGNCVMSGGGDCGVGTQQRQIVCASDWDPRIRDAAACSGTPAPTPTSRQCSVPCPADCDVDTWAPWTCTNGTCGGAGRRERSRAVIIAPNERGRQCPVLLQKERCAFDPCFSYAYERGPWGNCSVGLSSARCGVGIRERSVICRQSDGLSVPLECCIIKKCPSRSDSSYLINVDYRALNIHFQDVCGIACPGDCVVAPWSNWGPCSLDCSSGNGRGMRSRSRGIIVAASLGGLCPDQTSRIETEQCSANVQCFLYAWVTTPWANGVRNVSCVRTVQGGGGAVAVVDSGCVEALRPAAQQSCVSDTCDGAGQVCNTTAYRCQCRDGYFEARDECVPMSGCTDNRHCPLFHTACVGGECQCDPSVGAVQGENGMCVLPSTAPPTTAGPLTTEPATTRGGNAELISGTDNIRKFLSLLLLVILVNICIDLAYWAWIIIALGILILVAVVLFIVFWHQYVPDALFVITFIYFFSVSGVTKKALPFLPVKSMTRWIVYNHGLLIR